MTVSCRAILVILAMLPSTIALAADKNKLIPVVVFSTNPTDGFTDAGTKARNDSAIDLAGALKGRGIKVVTSEKEAVVEIEVIDRYLEAPQITGAVVIPSGRSAAIVPTRSHQAVVTATLKVGSVARTFEGRSTWAWWNAADAIAKQVKDWLKENDAKLREVMAQQADVLVPDQLPVPTPIAPLRVLANRELWKTNLRQTNAYLTATADGLRIELSGDSEFGDSEVEVRKLDNGWDGSTVSRRCPDGITLKLHQVADSGLAGSISCTGRRVLAISLTKR